MKHPFDGIIAHESRPAPGSPSRRSILGWLAAIPTGFVAWLIRGGRATADPPPAPTPETLSELDKKRARVEKFAQYYVVPANDRGFNTTRRKQLGLSGRIQTGWPTRPGFEDTRGYLSWMSADQAEQLRSDPNITAVHQFGSADTIVTGNATAGPTEIIVSLYPNAFRKKPDAGTFFSGDELIETWSKELSESPNVQVSTGMKGHKLYIWVKEGRVPSGLFSALKQNPQVYHVKFTGRTTTEILGEEGGQPPGNVVK